MLTCWIQIKDRVLGKSVEQGNQISKWFKRAVPILFKTALYILGY